MKQKHNIEELKNFYKTYNRLPSRKKDQALYKWMIDRIRYENKEVIEFTDSVGYKVRKKHKNYTISNLINFYKTYNRLPNKKEGYSLYVWMNIERNKGNKEVIEFTSSVGYEAREVHKPYTISDLINFYKSNNRLPNREDGNGLYGWMNIERRKGNKKVIEFTDSVGYKVKERHNPYTISDLIDFYKSNNRLPNSRKEEGLFKWMVRERDKGKNEVKTFLDLIDCKDKSIEAKEILESILKQTNM